VGQLSQAGLRLIVDPSAIVIPDDEIAKFKIVQHAYDYLVAHVPRWPKT